MKTRRVVLRPHTNKSFSRIDPARSGEDPTLSDAFGSQTISQIQETQGFASLLHNRFAFIVCNRELKERGLTRNPA